MKIINQSHEVLTPDSTLYQLTRDIERAARTCYKSEDKTTVGSDLELWIVVVIYIML